MMVHLPYFKQDTNYSCAPTVMEMVFRFYGKVFGEKDLIQMLKTKKDTGTHHNAMIDLARTEGFYVYVNNESSLDEVASLVKKNVPVIVHFIEPDNDEGHYAVIIDVKKDHIILDDPWNGEKFKMVIDDFEERWHSE